MPPLTAPCLPASDPTTWSRPTPARGAAPRRCVTPAGSRGTDCCVRSSARPLAAKRASSVNLASAPGEQRRRSLSRCWWPSSSASSTRFQGNCPRPRRRDRRLHGPSQEASAARHAPAGLAVVPGRPRPGSRWGREHRETGDLKSWDPKPPPARRLSRFSVSRSPATTGRLALVRPDRCRPLRTAHCLAMILSLMSS
jgi:hypothetical protein